MSILPLGMDGRLYNATYGEDGWQRNAAETLARSLERTRDPHAVQGNPPGIQSAVRTVTPENPEDGLDDSHITDDLSSVQTSPRSIPGGEKPRDRRQGLVFVDSHSSKSPEVDGRSGPPVSFHSQSRPRTRTLDEPPRQRSTSNSVSKSRHRISSVHSTNSSSFHDVEPTPPVPVTSAPLGFPSIATKPSPQ
jgi:hypothetical protein